jgi:hypothetical protein
MLSGILQVIDSNARFIRSSGLIFAREPIPQIVRHDDRALPVKHCNLCGNGVDYSLIERPTSTLTKVDFHVCPKLALTDYLACKHQEIKPAPGIIHQRGPS